MSAIARTRQALLCVIAAVIVTSCGTTGGAREDLSAYEAIPGSIAARRQIANAEGPIGSAPGVGVGVGAAGGSRGVYGGISIDLTSLLFRARRLRDVYEYEVQPRNAALVIVKSEERYDVGECVILFIPAKGGEPLLRKPKDC